VSGAIKLLKKLALCFFPVWCLLSCGLEPFLYIAFIPEGYYSDVSATVQLTPSTDEGYDNYFRNFVIYYRIYASGIFSSARIDNSTIRNDINATLNTDFNYLEPYTNTTSTTVSTANLDNIFTNRGYYKLALEGANVSGVLGSESINKQLIISFPPNTAERPTLQLVSGGVTFGSYALQRDADGRMIEPLPDLDFLNDPGLYNAANATRNTDVAPNSRTSPPILYTYVSLYIAAFGQDFLTYIYSQPTFLGTFRLAESN
jgi:hypothetical protein